MTPLSEDNEKVRSLEQRNGMVRQCEQEASGSIRRTGYRVGSTEPLQQRHEGGSDQGGRERGSEKWSDAGCAVQVALGDVGKTQTGVSGLGLRTQEKMAPASLRQGEAAGEAERKSPELGFENVTFEMLIRHSDEDVT